MKRLFILAFGMLIICSFASRAFTSTELFDDFSGTSINGHKWYEREFVREVVDAGLVSKLGNNSGSGVYRNTTAFQNPNSINVIECTVKVIDTVLDTGTMSKSFARIAGWVYNRYESGGARGDIFAQVIIGNRGNGLEAWWEVVEALDDNVTSWQDIGVGTLVGPGNLNFNTAYPVRLAYDQDTNEFTFDVDGASNVFTGPDWERPPVGLFKGLGTVVRSNDGSGTGYCYAKFDDVLINDEIEFYDTFDSTLLDPAKWKSLEVAREISDGKLRLDVQTEDSMRSSFASLKNYSNYLEATVTVKSDSWVSSGARGEARIAGYFYNENRGPGSGQDYNRYQGNVRAQIRIWLRDDSSLEAVAQVNNLIGPDESNLDHWGFLFRYPFTTPISFDTPYTLSIEFTEDSMFWFECNGETTSYTIDTPTYPPYNENRFLQSRIQADPSESGYMKAEFDDVYVEEASSANVLKFCDASVSDGTLVGDGRGQSADHRLDAVMQMIETADALVEEGDIDGACDQLMAAYTKTDGDPIPPDFVTGSAASDLAFMIDELRQSLGCE